MIGNKRLRHIIANIGLEDWTTTRDIVYRIHDQFDIDITGRDWRQWVAQYNSNFIDNGGRRWFIASSNKGYCRTRKPELIRATVNRRRNRLFHEWQKTNDLLRALGEQQNERMEFDG